MKEEETVEYYLEKPVPTQELKALFALTNIQTNDEKQDWNEIYHFFYLNYIYK